jgi:hypothetical protein
MVDPALPGCYMKLLFFSQIFVFFEKLERNSIVEPSKYYFTELHFFENFG